MPPVAFAALALVSVWIHWRVRRSGVAAGLVGADIAVKPQNARLTQ